MKDAGSERKHFKVPADLPLLLPVLAEDVREAASLLASSAKSKIRLPSRLPVFSRVSAIPAKSPTDGGWIIPITKGNKQASVRPGASN